MRARHAEQESWGGHDGILSKIFAPSPYPSDRRRSHTRLVAWQCAASQSPLFSSSISRIRRANSSGVIIFAPVVDHCWPPYPTIRSEEHTSELQSLMRNSYAVFCLKKKNKQKT